MAANVGTIDRVVRLVLGLALIAAPFLSNLSLFDNDILKYGAMAVGAVLLVTALASRCPIYSVLGLRTCRAR